MNSLDLTISIEGNRITTNTYQKSLNLYQYSLPMSEHPTSMTKSIIYGLMQNYHRQNTKQEDYCTWQPNYSKDTWQEAGVQIL